MFTANDGLVYDLIFRLYKFEHRNRINAVKKYIQKNNTIKLAQLMLDFKTNKDHLVDLHIFE